MTSGTVTQTARQGFFSAALVFAREGLGIALVDPFTIVSQNLKNLVVKPFRPIVSFDLIIIWANDKPLSLVGCAFIERLTVEMTRAQQIYNLHSFQNTIGD